MNTPHIDLLKTFDAASIPDLDEVVLGALELFATVPVPHVDTSKFARPLVVGSGNAEVTGKILFEGVDAVFASESTFEEKLNTIAAIDGVVLISASGGKHAPHIVKTAKEFGKEVLLITNTHDSLASKELTEIDHEVVFPKNREPYTYNTSTYMGMILSKTKEDASDIHSFIREVIEPLEKPDFRTYDKFFVLVPTRFSHIVRMIEIKFIELFGRQIARDVETIEYAKHATTVVPGDGLFISFGEENTTLGEHRLTIPLPEHADYGAMMAIAYYVIGKIQKAQPPFFKENIENYTKEASKVFGYDITIISE